MNSRTRRHHACTAQFLTQQNAHIEDAEVATRWVDIVLPHGRFWQEKHVDNLMWPRASQQHGPYQKLSRLHLLEVIDQDAICDIMLCQHLPNASDGKKNSLMSILEAFELPLELSIGSHVHSVVMLLKSHVVPVALLQLEDLVLLC